MYKLDMEMDKKITQPWNGLHVFPAVYAVQFEDAAAAARLVEGFYNNSGIHLTRLFCGGATYSIACSTLPQGWSVERKMEAQIGRWRERESQTGEDYRI